MAQKVTQYDLLVSCPGDIKDELRIIEEVLNQFNDSYADVLHVSVRIRHWTKSAYSESGGKPQELLNKQFVNNCDAAVAIFWTRFGTPTDTYGSGTEEEIEIMLEAGKQVFLYFSEIPVSLSNVDHVQYNKIQEFKARYSEKGLYFTYCEQEEFRKLFTAHLAKYFLSLEAVKEVQIVKQPILSVKSIGLNGSLEDTVTPDPFKSPIHQSVADMLEEIKALFQKINNYSKLPMTAFDMIKTVYQKPVIIGDEEKKYIIEFAKLTNIGLASDFFNLGGLKKDIIGNVGMLGVSPKLEGTTEEIKKYHDIIKLYEKLLEVVNWKTFEDSFSKIKCMRLCVKNDGTTFDEDIEISLRFSENMLILPGDMPMIDKFTLEGTDFSYYELFGIPQAINYLDFEASIKQPNPPQVSPPFSPLGLLYGNGKSEEEEYYETLNEVFDYDFFYEKDYIILKLHMDYLKHNTAVAFPTVLFVTDKIIDIEYTITSKHCDSPTAGVIKTVTL